MRQIVTEINDQELLYLKFQKRFSTQQLLTLFPQQKQRIAEVALLDVNPRRLHRLIDPSQKKFWLRFRILRKALSRRKKGERQLRCGYKGKL